MSSYENLDCPQGTAGKLRRKRKVKQKEKSLSEIAKELNMTRKVIQGYEKHGLVECSYKGKGNQLIYDEKNYDRIIRIRFLQKLGFTLKEIEKLIRTEDDMMICSLIQKEEETNRKISSLEARKAMIEFIVNQLEEGQTIDKETVLKIAREEWK